MEAKFLWIMICIKGVIRLILWSICASEVSTYICPPHVKRMQKSFSDLKGTFFPKADGYGVKNGQLLAEWLMDLKIAGNSI